MRLKDLMEGKMSNLMTMPASTMGDGPEWVLAAPFRAHVSHLMETAQVPWQLIAYQAGVPLATLRTLLFGRHGKARTKITQSAAAQLIGLGSDDLRWMRHSQTSAETTGARIRLLRSHDISWPQIAELLSLDNDTCQAIARGERTSCSVMTDILAQSACDALGLDLLEYSKNPESSTDPTS